MLTEGILFVAPISIVREGRPAPTLVVVEKRAWNLAPLIREIWAAGFMCHCNARLGYMALHTIKTAIDGRAGVSATKFGRALVSGDKPAAATLVIRCYRNSTEAYVTPVYKRGMPFDDQMRFAYHTDTHVRYKLNDGPIAKGWWNASSNNDAVGLWRGAAMRGPGSYEFDLDGIKEAIARLPKSAGGRCDYACRHRPHSAAVFDRHNPQRRRDRVNHLRSLHHRGRIHGVQWATGGSPPCLG